MKPLIITALLMTAPAMAMDFEEYDRCHERNQDKITTQNLLITVTMFTNLVDVLATTVVTEVAIEQENCSRHLQ